MGTVCSAVGGPRGTNFSATDVPGGPILGGTNYRMTGAMLLFAHNLSRIGGW